MENPFSALLSNTNTEAAHAVLHDTGLLLSVPDLYHPSLSMDTVTMGNKANAMEKYKHLPTFTFNRGLLLMGT